MTVNHISFLGTQKLKLSLLRGARSLWLYHFRKFRFTLKRKELPDQLKCKDGGMGSHLRERRAHR
jgi:hypothetical protein